MKIAFVGILEEPSYTEQNGEWQLKGVGYLLMNQNKIKEIIDVFELNVTLYPQSANVYDSPGEPILKTVQKSLQ